MSLAASTWAMLVIAEYQPKFDMEPVEGKSYD
jgi:hypothetical protein